jgi:CubicO group peptidase (beta-lactamase class C family)
VTTTHRAGDGRAIHGTVDDGFGPVMDAFIRNFDERHDLGAGCTVYVDGRPVVDLWGGIADSRTGRPFERDSATVMFSCTKGVMALCAYLLVQEGRLDLDAPIARYWPEFGQAGKEAITVRDAMAHRAGLSYLDTDLTLDEALAWDPVILAIEIQAPHNKPSEGHAYHAVTIGWILGEMIRRITGLSAGTYFRRVLGDPLGLDMWIGVPEAARGKVAWMEPPLPDDDSEFAKGFARLGSARHVERAMTLGKAFGFPAEGGQVTFNNPRIQAAEVPGAGGVGSAAALARLYAACVSAVDGVGPLLTGSSIADALRVRSEGPQLTGQPDDGPRWGSGFQISSPPFVPMLGPTSFGHTGAGGQLGFADVAHRASFAYLTNQMGGYGDRRAHELVEAVRSVLEGPVRKRGRAGAPDRRS